MTTNSNLPEGLSEADVQLLIDNPGQTIAGVAGQPPEVIQASHSVDITEPAARGIRPQVGGHVAGKPRISRPSPNLPARLAAGDEERKALEEARRVEREEHAKATDPAAMAKQLAVLNRQVRKLSKEIAELKRGSDV